MATQTQERSEARPEQAQMSPGLALRGQILRGQGTQQLEKRLEELIVEISKAEDDVSSTKITLGGAKDMLEISEARLTLETEGKNAEERKANLAILRGKDSEYRQQYAAVEKAQVAFDDAQNALATLEREFKLKTHILALRAAQLNFLAGAE